jgi:hypothetical protein
VALNRVTSLDPCGHRSAFLPFCCQLICTDMLAYLRDALSFLNSMKDSKRFSRKVL